MKNLVKNMIPAAALIFSASAATAGVIDFETTDGYTAVGVYDIWENSPLNLGAISGNFAVTDNPDTSADEGTGLQPNGSAKVLGAQRSRFGSNRFGARVDLSTENQFKLTPTVQYVHVNLLTPEAGRVMLIGLGSRDDDSEQDLHVVQFQKMSNNRMTPNQWTDMVFAVKGAGGITVRSLVLVPHCESPHELDDDFLFYIDNLEVNNSPTPTIQHGFYPINADKETTGMTRTDRYTNSITINKDTLQINQNSSKKLYYELLDKPVIARAGESMTVKINASFSTWMHSYVYLDLNNDGKFNNELNSDGTPAEGSEVVAYSCYNAKDSKGASASNQYSFHAPAFTLPADMASGVYRLRAKLDWNNIDPAGNDAAGNLIADNGGVIVDVPVIVVAAGDKATVNDNQLNGEVLAADGTKLNALQVPALEDYALKMNPENGFACTGLDVFYGFDLNGDQFDKYGNPQWFTKGYTFTDLNQDFTLPADVMFGNVRVEGRMTEITTIPATYGYTVNFPADMAPTRTDRHLNSMTFTNQTTSKQFTQNIPQTTIYVDATKDLVVEVRPGDVVKLDVNFTGNAMHSYIYADWNKDKDFDVTLNEDGTPAAELMAFTYYSTKDSKGNTLNYSQVPGKINEYPFTVPTNIENGAYVGRYKIDWDDVTPGGRYNQASNNIDANGGKVVDFLFNVTGSDVTGITEVSAEETPAVIYDLQGRRHSRPFPGVNIINGRKVIVK